MLLCNSVLSRQSAKVINYNVDDNKQLLSRNIYVMTKEELVKTKAIRHDRPSLSVSHIFDIIMHVFITRHVLLCGIL